MINILIGTFKHTTNNEDFGCCYICVWVGFKINVDRRRERGKTVFLDLQAKDVSFDTLWSNENLKLEPVFNEISKACWLKGDALQ